MWGRVRMVPVRWTEPHQNSARLYYGTERFKELNGTLSELR